MGAGEGWWRQGQPAAAPSGGSRASRRQAQVVPLCRRMTSLPLGDCSMAVKGCHADQDGAGWQQRR